MARKKKEEVKEIKKGIKAKQEDIEIMSLDNKPISKETTKEPIQVHDKFASVPPKLFDTKRTINVKNGRVYKDLGNGYGMYSDTGEAFRI